MVLSLVGVFGGFRSSVCSLASLVGAGGPAPCRLALPDRVCIRPSLCSKRVPRFKQKRPACGGFSVVPTGLTLLAKLYPASVESAIVALNLSLYNPILL